MILDEYKSRIDCLVGKKLIRTIKKEKYNKSIANKIHNANTIELVEYRLFTKEAIHSCWGYEKGYSFNMQNIS